MLIAPLPARLGQRITLYIAFVSYLLCLVTAGFSFSYYQLHGSENAIFASLLAGILFFVTMGFVLHMMARTNIPSFAVVPPANVNKR
ncbi:MAG: hemerythrin family protein [Gammaproteobacteria bacterium]|nr:hemerythrin family protein [Gammaproteobacteria bacterium]